MAAKVSTGRRGALAVLLAAPDHCARESNATMAGAPPSSPTIYWQSRAWLSEHGYIEPCSCPAPTSYPGTWRYGWYRLTESGLELARQQPGAR